MQLTRLGHACVRLQTAEGLTAVIDPGMFSAPDAIAGARVLLITHEHGDHVQPEVVLRALEDQPGLHVWTNAAVAEQLAAPVGRVTVVGHGDAFTIDGLDVRVYGEWHALVHPDIPRVTNVGFLLGDGVLFHPGDAFTVPDSKVDTLLLPVHAPWSKGAEVVDYVREVMPAQALPIHDGMLNDIGVGLVGTLLTRTHTPYRATASDETVALAG